ncbi:MAG TPA: Smr/MutS family protein [Rhizomicrobium sp.]|jgi:DNA-nicking Smr family endonuclease|nr:Smr/MutS family protein [Rhizomicrobium sp.]
MSRRRTTDEERALFAEAFREARPLNPSAKPASGPVPKPPAGAAPKFTGGLDGNTAARLRRGEIDPDRRIDLHGKTEAAAHRALLGFLRQAQRSGARLALVITGKGAGEPDPYEPFDLERASRARGVLKAMVPRWLKEPEFAALIADHRAAHRRHGGTGAFYVYLRKKR